MVQPPPERSKKVFVPVKEHPDINFVGYIIGPRVRMVRQLQQDTGCKISLQGKGREGRKKAIKEHLNDELHVLITAEESWGCAERRLEKAVKKMQRILWLLTEEQENIKRQQMQQSMEQAIIHEANSINSKANKETHSKTQTP